MKNYIKDKWMPLLCLLISFILFFIFMVLAGVEPITLLMLIVFVLSQMLFVWGIIFLL